ncbi:MAG: PEGA domain-containing protein [Lachnospiraceae bacterium]|nr:PEGA domain-containing protein [Lachnospiraceae bacterium]
MIIIQAAIMMMAACGSNTAMPAEEDIHIEYVAEGAGVYDSADEAAVLVSKDTKAGTITLYNRRKGKNYTLSYDGTTIISDKYGEALAMKQLEPGQLVDVLFLKSDKKLKSVTVSQSAWELENVTDHLVDEDKRIMTIGTETYKLDKKVAVYYNGRKTELMDVNPIDTLTVRGVDKVVDSIIVEKSHGYLRLKGEDYFVDGWIEVNSHLIRKITANMLIPVPVGSYSVNISKDKIKGDKNVVIEANRETEIDLSDLVPEDMEEYGNIIVVCDPPEAEIYIDGAPEDISRPISLLYGIHQLIARADGYKTLTQYIKVNTPNATLSVTLESSGVQKDKDNEEGDTTDKPAPSPTPLLTSPVETSEQGNGGKVTVNAPSGCEVYLDGTYLGITPLSFDKNAGTHVITLRKEGFVTRSYTITFDDTDNNENYSFNELDKNA